MNENVEVKEHNKAAMDVQWPRYWFVLLDSNKTHNNTSYGNGNE